MPDKRKTFTLLTMEELNELEKIVEKYSLLGISPFLYQHTVDSLIGMAKGYFRNSLHGDEE